MCTAIGLTAEHFYFGRNLDWKDRCKGSVTVCPRNFPFHFKNGTQIRQHYAIIGVAAIADGYPLYFDGANEAGLAIAGLNFPHFCNYFPYNGDKNNLAPYEVIPWLLSRCQKLSEAIASLENTNLWDRPFSDQIPVSPLHWLIADKNGSAVLESTADGLRIYDNPYGILTNSPPFPYHVLNMNRYIGLSNKNPINSISEKIPMEPYSFGMGALGLPGDPSSPSRFARAAFTKLQTPEPFSKEETLSHFFHILSSVEQQKGIARFPSGEYEYTAYSSCCDVTQCIYYYTTYQNRCIHAVDMKKCDLNSEELSIYPFRDTLSIYAEN